MRPIFKRITLLCTGTLLMACAGVPHGPSDSHSVLAGAQESYLIGRTHHMSLRFEQALTHYTAALRAAPAHVEARNGLAALYAEQGRLNEAVALWDKLTASATGTGSAYLFSNLGHAHMLRGDFSKAQIALTQACLLDPLDPHAWQRLGTTLQKLDQPERAQAMHRQASALRGHDLKSDYAVARSAGLPAINEAVPAVSTDGEHWARTDVSRAADGTFIMRRIEPEAKASKTASAANFAGNVLLEISYGNGVTGMARTVARDAGFGPARQVRLTNQKGFSVRHTRVEYKPAFKEEAEQLAVRYGTTRVVEVDGASRADVRLVVGRDMRKAVLTTVSAVQQNGRKAG